MEIAGSSPLARGLPALSDADRLLFRIIPARAGFTPIPSHAPRCLPDHPRSRGVYSPTDGYTMGLRRIIPARAGFTSNFCSFMARARDHPRSRGVYGNLFGLEEDSAGSSPLARGLLACVPMPRVCHRIIPARAGFTLAVVMLLSPGRDHPRSRGVYAWSFSTG